MNPPLSLNDRQRTYLLEVFRLDQEAEAYEASAWNDGRMRRPADVWRWIPYTALPNGDPTPLHSSLRDHKLVDPGTGATFKALEERKYLQCRWEMHGDGSRIENWLFVKLTPLGRKLGRELSGESAKKKLPAGTLQPWQWQALELAYQAREAGLEKYYGPGRGFMEYGRVNWKTWLRLRDYKAGDLVAEHMVPGSEDMGAYPYPKLGEYRMFITPFGKQYYEHEKERYQALYGITQEEG